MKQNKSTIAQKNVGKVWMSIDKIMSNYVQIRWLAEELLSDQKHGFSLNKNCLHLYYFAEL